MTTRAESSTASPMGRARTPVRWTASGRRRRADLHADPCWSWLLDQALLHVPARGSVRSGSRSLIDFPPRRTPAPFTLDETVAQLGEGGIDAHWPKRSTPEQRERR